MFKPVLFDTRWPVTSGIGRFSTELFKRMNNCISYNNTDHPLSVKSLIKLNYHLLSDQYRCFFTPGFNSPLFSKIPVIISIHDLNHLDVTDNRSWAKVKFYEWYLKPAARKSYKIITLSHFTKDKLLEWLKVPEDKIDVVKVGVNDHFSKRQPIIPIDTPYFLYVGNSKPHKNLLRMIEAFSKAKIDSDIKMVLVSELSKEILDCIDKNKVRNRVFNFMQLSDEKLAAFYQNAICALLPSLYEGFGLPIIEAMASQTPVLTSNITSMPEIAGNAAYFINPYCVDEIKYGIEQLASNHSLRENLILRGSNQIKKYSWDLATIQMNNIVENI